MRTPQMPASLLYSQQARGRMPTEEAWGYGIATADGWRMNSKECCWLSGVQLSGWLILYRGGGGGSRGQRNVCVPKIDLQGRPL